MAFVFADFIRIAAAGAVIGSLGYLASLYVQPGKTDGCSSAESLGAEIQTSPLQRTKSKTMVSYNSPYFDQEKSKQRPLQNLKDTLKYAADQAMKETSDNSLQTKTDLSISRSDLNKYNRYNNDV